MSEVIKDCAIKLFGKTISFSPEKIVSDFTAPREQQQSSSETSISSQESKELSAKDFPDDDDSINPTEETLTDNSDEKNVSSSPNTPDEESSLSNELKSPEKLLPCPRCNSSDTKFCYYNNYNVKQPRHFCKKCQRYWTAGGSMRNVPIGSGRRKTKHSAIQHHLMVSEFDPTNGVGFSPNGFFIFGSDNQTSRNDFSKGSNISPGQCFAPAPYPYPYPYPSGVPVTFWSCPSDMCTSPSTLGKHSREAKSSSGKENISEKKSGFSIPKTLRIDDSSEAAKSSIWSTLGIKNKKTGSINGSGLFKAFESKGDGHSSNLSNSIMVMRANPAALSRSLKFQEST